MFAPGVAACWNRDRSASRRPASRGIGGNIVYEAVEWAWRSLTWFRFQPMKMADARKEVTA